MLDVTFKPSDRESSSIRPVIRRSAADMMAGMYFVVDVVEHLGQIYIEAIYYVSHDRSGCVDGNIIGVFDQLDVIESQLDGN